MSLRSLALTNFRGYSEHRIEFGKESVLIGQNNAGKTTALEALRVLSVAVARVRTASFEMAPPWTDGHCSGAGFNFSLATIDFDHTNVQHSYDQSRPAILKAVFTNNSQVIVYLGASEKQVFCQVKQNQRTVATNREMAAAANLTQIKVMPPIGSLLPNESIISKQYLARYLDGYLAYRHFRNQLWERPPEYRKFKKLLEDTWTNLQIKSFENDHGPEKNQFSMLVREGKFTSEISWHGHGLQAWMQTIWFLARTDRKNTIVLDEPDVYLHADLQRKLIKVIESLGFRQWIVATHSSEIIGDVPFQNVVVVKKHERVSKSAGDANDIQSALRGMGSLHAIQLAKVAEGGVVLFVEGDDKPFLTDVAYKLASSVFDKFSRIAVQEIAGKGNWREALGAAKALKEASAGQVKSVLLLDRDHSSEAQLDSYRSDAKNAELVLKIWKRKEIENYAVCPSAIARFVNQHSEVGISEQEVSDLLEKIGNEARQDIILSFADELMKENRKLVTKTAFKKAQDHVQRRLEEGAKLHHLMSGKTVFAHVSKHYQDTAKVSFSALAIFKSMRLSEVDSEVTSFVEGVTNPLKLSCKSFMD